MELIPVLIGAIQIQQSQIDNLTEQIKSLTGSELKSATLSNNMDLDIAESATLGQNIPNPFTEMDLCMSKGLLIILRPKEK
ncbi:MAG: hypothetical protein JXR52_01380 [Bacteroidales bacterium]|nr:hypothetical protein [Bacteroidales bacterium]